MHVVAAQTTGTSAHLVLLSDVLLLPSLSVCHACCARCAVLTYFEDSRVAMWLVFSDVWNAIVEELRAMDLVSDGERDNLVFVHLDIDQSIEVGLSRAWGLVWAAGAAEGAAAAAALSRLCCCLLPLGALPHPSTVGPRLPCPPPPLARQILDGMRPFMMPIFFYGGQISKALESPSLNAAQQVALTEIRSLLTWLLMQVRGGGAEWAVLPALGTACMLDNCMPSRAVTF
jgi:hypothetical protein